MTPADAVLRVRAIYDENGVTSGFLDNTNDIYKFIDSGHTELITIGIMKLRQSREIPGGTGSKESPILKPLIKLDPLNTTTVGAGIQEYALPSDYIETYKASYTSDYGVSTTLKKCILKSFDEIDIREQISLLASEINHPVYYIRFGKLGFYPQPNVGHANGYEHYYIYKPSEITSSSSAFTLGIETHEAIVKYTAYLSLIKDGQLPLAEDFLKQFYQLASQL